MMIERSLVKTLRQRLGGARPLIHIVVGPRQVGKTTAVEQVQRRWKGPTFYASADLPSPPDAYWIQSQWQAARQKVIDQKRPVLLILDEVQKISRWGDVVKACFDEDRRARRAVRAVLLGSAALHVQRGAQESLAGRFELHFCPHWSWPESRKAFGWSLDQWIFYGGYPGAAPMIRDPARWSHYITNALIESVLARDVLQLATVVKPALLRQLFRLATHQPAQMLSYNKMLGQLQDAGNTVTLAHYLQLLSSAYLVSGLNVWSGGIARHRASSPKLVVWNNALINAWPGQTLDALRSKPESWGRLVENAVGGHLLNNAENGPIFYWREGDLEVDYVLERAGQLLALEVKSGRPRSAGGLAAFQKRYPKSKAFVIGSGGIPLEQFFSVHPSSWF